MVRKSTPPDPMTIQTAVLAQLISAMLLMTVAPPSVIAAVAMPLPGMMKHKAMSANTVTNAILLEVSMIRVLGKAKQRYPINPRNEPTKM